MLHVLPQRQPAGTAQASPPSEVPGNWHKQAVLWPLAGLGRCPHVGSVLHRASWHLVEQSRPLFPFLFFSSD